MIRLSHLLCIASIVCLIGSASAQESSKTLRVPATNDVATWPKPARYPYWQTVNLVLLAEPKVRHKCHVSSISADAITCGIGQHAAIYKRDDIAAIIEPPFNPELRAVTIYLAVGAALIAGSFFVPELPLVILMRVVGGIAIYTTAWGTGGGHGEILLYQRPGTELAVKLRY